MTELVGFLLAFGGFLCGFFFGMLFVVLINKIFDK